MEGYLLRVRRNPPGTADSTDSPDAPFGRGPNMRKSLFGAAWLFIFAVASYDLYFAWHYRAVFGAWELNPVARWAAELYGLRALFAAKALLTGFIVIVGAYCYRSHHPLTTPYTAFAGAVHHFLSLHYLLGYLDGE
jgi:hypothetical protein